MKSVTSGWKRYPPKVHSGTDSNEANMAKSLSRRYEHLLNSEKYCDCSFVFHRDGTVMQINCHKLILAASSPVFEAMFYGPMREIAGEIEIADISAEIFHILLTYIYTGRVNYDDLGLEQTVELYYGAEKYLLNELVSECLQAITHKLRFINILPALDLCVCMDLHGLLDVCMSFFARCCLNDVQQFIQHLRSHYYHVSKECVQAIVAHNRDQQREVLWFVCDWCRRECKRMGLQKNDTALVIDDLHLPDGELAWFITEAAVGGSTGNDLSKLGINSTKIIQCKTIDRGYFKACRPFIVDWNTNVWRVVVRSDRFIALHGIILHSRLTPHMAPSSFPNDYKESLQLVISSMSGDDNAAGNANGACADISSDGEEQEHDTDEDNDNDVDDDEAISDNAGNAAQMPHIIWQQIVNKQTTKYNCNLNLNWQKGVTLSPDIDYEIKISWCSDAYGAEYPCSLLSNLEDGIEFRDMDAYDGSLLKGLRFSNLV